MTTNTGPRTGTTWRPAASIGLLGMAAILAGVVFSGATFRLTNGSEIGLYLTVALLWSSAAFAFWGLWVAYRGLRRPARERATIHEFRAREPRAGEWRDAA